MTLNLTEKRRLPCLQDFFEGQQPVFINGRNGQNVLNQNNVTVDENGLLVFNLQSDDGAIIGSEAYETHRAEFDCLFNGGADRSPWDVDFVYRNLTKLTT